VVQTCDPSHSGSGSRKTRSEAGLGKVSKTLPEKQAKSKRVGVVDQEVEACLWGTKKEKLPGEMSIP
jgi:hypothetical protein